MFLSIALIVLLIGLAYFWLKHSRDYWSGSALPSEKATYLFFGRKQHFAFYFQSLYERYKHEHGAIGIFIVTAPAVLLLDLDLIKRVFIADFESFSDRGLYTNVHDDPLSSNLLRLRVESWRTMRVKMTPTFTSGKIKFMFPAVLDVGKRFVAAISDQLMDRHDDLEMRDLCARFTTDVIGSVAFGIECNSLKDPNTQFRRMGDRAFASLRPWLEVLGVNHQRLLNRLRVKVFPTELIQFYTNLVRQNIEHRLATNERRNDFLNILIEMCTTKDEQGNTALTMKEAIGQAFVFFIAGFDTSSNTMTFCLYELCKNPEIQEKVRRDIHDALQKHNNELTYECLKEMKYLEKVVLETLRKYPVAPNLKRICRKPWRIPNTNHTIENGIQVLIPVYAIHHDPVYYPEPDKFDPERFTPEAIEKRHAMSYLPFGAGPRTCIAERFGKIQTSLGLAMLLNDFKFIATESTPAVLEYDLTNLRTFSVKGGIRMKVVKI